ncbi:hypothetical protein RJT34_12697 [Clitoria ternatea]|uniref:Uncharacterized protein n=1 Tax=Clitoria ternatea TaxID=43366 RepID=A0AAN9PKR8_CLITE
MGCLSAIDVPEGFLLEWWSSNYDFDFFKAQLQMKGTQGLEATQGYTTFSYKKAKCSMNVEAKNHLPGDFTPSTFLTLPH